MSQPRLKQIGGMERGGEGDHLLTLEPQGDGQRGRSGLERMRRLRVREREVFQVHRGMRRRIPFQVRNRNPHAKSIRPLGTAVRPPIWPIRPIESETGNRFQHKILGID